MNYANKQQLKAVAQSCRYFDGGNNLKSIIDTNEDISCSICHNWDGERCIINAFDSVLTGLDQT